jgi:hypothetical protein
VELNRKSPVGGSSPGSQEPVLKLKFWSYEFRDQLQGHMKDRRVKYETKMAATRRDLAVTWAPSSGWHRAGKIKQNTAQYKKIAGILEVSMVSLPFQMPLVLTFHTGLLWKISTEMY